MMMNYLKMLFYSFDKELSSLGKLSGMIDCNKYMLDHKIKNWADVENEINSIYTTLKTKRFNSTRFGKDKIEILKGYADIVLSECEDVIKKYKP